MPLPVTAAADATRAGAGDAAGSCESGTSTAGCQGGTGGVVGGGGGGQPARARSVGGGATVVVVEVGAAVLSAGRRSATGGAAAGLRPDRGVDCRDEAEANTETRTRTAVAAVTASADRSGSLRARRRAADSAPGCGGVPSTSVTAALVPPEVCVPTVTSVPPTRPNSRACPDQTRGGAAPSHRRPKAKASP